MMRLGKTPSVEELQLIGRFESLRKVLLSDAYREHLDRPLAYWALPTDRRLPLAFLGRTLRELLDTSFADLAATAGIGRKKVGSLVRLLGRAANTDPADLPIEVADSLDVASDDSRLDPNTVSEVAWAHWRASVVRHGLESEKLGRFAPTLRNMTRVIWNSPLGAYTGATLAEIRAMRTHGEKRVAAIIEVFHTVHSLVAGMGAHEHLVVRIVPRRIDRVEQWTGLLLQRRGIPSQREIFENYIEPLLEQVRVDATQQVAVLAENRLGINGPIASVRQAARLMELTRARIYQLLNEINDVMMVRWPMGRHLSHELREKLQAEAAESNEPVDLSQFLAAVELFYPGSRRGASGAVEHFDDAAEPREGSLVSVG